MSTYVLKADVLNRLFKICNFFDSAMTEDEKKVINTVRVEKRGGQIIAVATNRKIAVAEYCGETDEKDECIHLKITPTLLEQIRVAAKNDSITTIQTVPEIALSTLQTSCGLIASDICHWFDETPLNQWRTWFKESDQTKGFMEWDIFHIETLIESSTSENIIFPEIIDSNRPVILRDRYNDNWMGVFIPSPTEGVKPAKIPDWF